MAQSKNKKKKKTVKASKFLDFSINDLQKVAPSKHALNIIVGFDPIYKQFKFLRLFGLKYDQVDIQGFPYESPFLSEDFIGEFKNAIDEYFKTLPTTHSLACYVVMPDNCVSINDMALPTMNSKKIMDALNTSLQKEYKNLKQLAIKHYVVSNNRQYVVFNIVAMNNAYLNNVYRTLAINKLYPKVSTYSANAMVDAVLQFKPSYKKKSFILFDVKAEYTHVAIVLKGKTYGFSEFRLGHQHLIDDKVLQENMQYEHDVADLAIINAKEAAKKKQLTVEEDPDIADVADSVTEQLIEGTNKNEQVDDTFSKVMEENAKPENNALSEQAQDIIDANKTQEEIDAEYEDAEIAEEERKARLMEEMKAARKKKVFARKMPRRLPKFMMREEPTTSEGFMYENFRMFIKWALLYDNEIEKQEYLEDITEVLVNIDEKYKFLIDMANDAANEEEGYETDLHFTYLDGLAPNVAANLELIGALFAGMHNKRHNF